MSIPGQTKRQKTKRRTNCEFCYTLKASTFNSALNKYRIALKTKTFVSYKSSKILPKHISTIEAGISDFHKLVAIVLRMFNKKAKTENH